MADALDYLLLETRDLDLARRPSADLSSYLDVLDLAVPASLVQQDAAVVQRATHALMRRRPGQQGQQPAGQQGHQQQAAGRSDTAAKTSGGRANSSRPRLLLQAQPSMVARMADEQVGRFRARPAGDVYLASLLTDDDAASRTVPVRCCDGLLHDGCSMAAGTASALTSLSS